MLDVRTLLGGVHTPTLAFVIVHCLSFHVMHLAARDARSEGMTDAVCDCYQSTDSLTLWRSSNSLGVDRQRFKHETTEL